MYAKRFLHWLGATVLLASTAAAADYPLEIIELHSRLPEDVIPILAPLAGADGTVVGSGSALFVRASPERLADIRRALFEIDRPVQGLLIQVRQGGTTQGSAAGFGDGGNGARVRIGPPGPGGTGVGAWAGERSRERSILQQVRAIDGRPARIAIGSDRPLPLRETARGPGHRVTREGAIYHRSETGFSVLPRVQGDRVTLEIATIASDPGAAGVTRDAGVSTRVEGRLGDWIPIGTSSDRRSGQDAGLIHAARGQETSDLQIEIRVVPAP